MFDRKRNAKKGFTLVELCIVIAIMAIVTTMIVSFCALVSVRAKKTNELNSTMEDISSINVALDRWVAFFDSDEYEISVGEYEGENEKGNYLVMSSKENVSSFSFKLLESKIYSEYLDDDDKITSLSKVATITYNIKTYEEPLITCTVVFENGEVYTILKSVRAAEEKTTEVTP